MRSRANIDEIIKVKRIGKKSAGEKSQRDEK